MTSFYDINHDCKACPLSEGCKAPVPAVGQGRVMLVGEAPGRNEDKFGKPFTGDAGKYLDSLLASVGVKRTEVMISNVVKCRPLRNRTPSKQEADFCASRWLDVEVEINQPDIIVAMGKVAIEHFLGEGVTVEHVHGIPVGNVLPIYHPAAGFYDTRLMRAIQSDFEVLGKLVKGLEIEHPVDELEAVYSEVLPPEERKSYVEKTAWDTEVVDNKLWSFQASDKAGTGDFMDAGVWGFIPGDKRSVVHNYLYDARWIPLPDDTDDTMLMAYVLGLPQGLKELAWRLCGMEMKSYHEVIGGHRRQKGMDYLERAAKPGTALPPTSRSSDLPTSSESEAIITDSQERLSLMKTCLQYLLDDPGHTAGEVGDATGLGHQRVWRRISDLKNLDLVFSVGARAWTNNRNQAIWWPSEGASVDRLDDWPDPPELENVVWNKKDNKLEVQRKRPQNIGRKIKRILADVMSGKVLKDGPVDPWARWHNIDARERAVVEDVLGPMPDASLADIPREEAVYYATRDSDATLRVYEKLMPMIEEQELGMVYQMDRATLPVAMEMQREGISVDVEHLRNLGRHYLERMEAKAEQIFETASIPFAQGVNEVGVKIWRFNPNSDDAIRKLFYEHLGFKPTAFTPTGLPSVKGSELAKIDHPLVPMVEEYRHLAHIKDSFCDTLPDKVVDGNIHPTINVTRTETGRWSMKQPNLQQIPARTEIGRAIRKAFIATPWASLVAIDYSQIEMRVAAHLAGCRSMIDLFLEGRDIHTETASQIFDVPLDQVTSQMRYPTKTMGFGVVYGLTPHGLHNQMVQEGLDDWTESKCEEFIQEYYRLRPELRVWQEGVKAQARRDGYVKDMFGRIRYTPELLCPIERYQGAGERQAINMPVQSSAQGIIKLAMGEMHRRREETVRFTWLLQIHDEIMVEVLDQLKNGFIAWAVRIMESAVKLSVPVVVEAKAGQNWAEMEKALVKRV